MTVKPNPIPLRPDYAAVRRHPITPVVKLAVAHLLAHEESRHPDDIVDREYGGDREADRWRDATKHPGKHEEAASKPSKR
jgi:hypothetical protein